MKENTCGNCPNVNTTMALNMPIFGCKLDGLVIPHYADATTEEVKFWRVPKSCQRPDSEVVKSASRAPERDWIIKTFSDFK